MVNGALVVVRRRLADELADGGEREEAARWQRRSLDTVGTEPEMLYLLAVEYAQSAELTGKLPTRLNADQLRNRRRRFVASAVTMLGLAVARGFKDAGRLRREPTFQSFRSEPNFAAIVADIEFPLQAFSGDRG